MDEPKKKRGRPPKDPRMGAMTGRERNVNYRNQARSELYALAADWCVLMVDIEHSNPDAARLMRGNMRARNAAVRIMGAEDVEAAFARTPISVTAQKHKDVDTRLWARSPHDEDAVDEAPKDRNNF